MENKNLEKFRNEQNVSFAKNVLMLAIAQIVVKVLGLVYKIIIVNIDGFGNTGSGYYSTGYQIYMVLLAISSIGIPNVVSKLVSERIAKGDHKAAYRVFSLTFKIVTAVAFVLAAILFIFAKQVSVALFNTDGVAYTLMALSPAVLFVSSNSVLRGYFTGLGSLKSTSISEIVEQFFNCLLSILFVYMAVGNSTPIMAAAGNVSTSVAALISLGYMASHFVLRKKYIKLECKEQNVPTEKINTMALIKTIVYLAVPAAFASLVSTLSSNIDSITVNQITGDMAAYGLMSKTETLTHLPLALGATLFTAMVPVVSSKLSKGEKESASKHLSDTLFLSNTIMLPCAAGFIVLATPILKLLYPNVWDGGFLLQLQTIAMIFASITFVLNGAFYGMGKQKFPAVILLIGAILKLLLNVITLSLFNLGAVGAVISTIIYQLAVTVAEWFILKKYITIKIEYSRQIVKPIISTLIMALIVYVSYYLLSMVFGNTISTLGSIIIGALSYFIVILKLKTFTENDISLLPMGNKIYSILNKIKLI